MGQVEVNDRDRLRRPEERKKLFMKYDWNELNSTNYPILNSYQAQIVVSKWAVSFS